MSVSDRPVLPPACSLTSAAGTGQLVAWREFNDDYLLDVARTAGGVTAHYAKVTDAIVRLTDLVATERSCCSFVDWAIDDTHADLRLVVTGSAEQLAALTFLDDAPVAATRGEG